MHKSRSRTVRVRCCRGVNRLDGAPETGWECRAEAVPRPQTTITYQAHVGGTPQPFRGDLASRPAFGSAFEPVQQSLSVPRGRFSACPNRPGGPCARRMIPLESPVPEIGTPGSESRGWKRDDGSRLRPGTKAPESGKKMLMLEEHRSRRSGVPPGVWFRFRTGSSRFRPKGSLFSTEREPLCVIRKEDVHPESHPAQLATRLAALRGAATA